MSTDLTPFVFPVTGEAVRTVVIDGEPWFIAADVTAILGYANGRMSIGALPERMKSSVTIADGTPGNPNRSVINEAGVYRLVMRSNLMAAEQFQDWLAEDVIPSIRRTGSYVAPSLTNRDLALMVIAEADRAERAEQRVAELAPAAESWETLAAANGDYSVADAAKVLSRDGSIQIGRDRLFTMLAKLGWTYRAGDGRWRVKQTAVETGRLSELPSSHYHPRTGELVLDPPQVRVTVKGVADLRRALGAKALEVAR
jgi:prophage antirepressor-like protein